MSRAIALVVFALLVAGLFLVPPADPVRLASIQVGDLLREPAQVLAGSEWQDEGRPLWRHLVEGTASETRPDGTVEVRILGSRMIWEGQAVEDMILHDYARQSVVRSLRAIVSEDGMAANARAPLEVVFKPTEGFRGTALATTLREGELELVLANPDGETFRARMAYRPPTQLSLLPPLVAIFLAILFRRPIVALLAGVVTGAFLRAHGSGLAAPEAGQAAVLDVGRKYFWDQLVDPGRIEIILFVVFMLALVGVITRAGGIQGLMNRIARLASSLRRTQIATWLMGLAVFFDDYANAILVGTTMRPLADRHRMAREKLAYIVDSTSAPVAGISLFSTWIAFEVSTFSAQLPDAGLAASDGYMVFLRTLPYRFYCLLTLFFVGLLVLTGRAFGPMLAAEERALGGQVLRDGATPMVSGKATELAAVDHVRPRARIALFPLGVFVFGTIGWILFRGGFFSADFAAGRIESWNRVLQEGSGSEPLMYGALAGLGTAALLGLAAGLGAEVLRAAWASVRSMSVAIAILYLAWMIGAVCQDLSTAVYLSALARESLPSIVLPLILFLLSAVVAFSTGSSWSTMTILLPIVIGLAYNLGAVGPMGGVALVVMSIGAVLEGAIFGDHCSPISDTTVMSSIASASDHIDHVRTQMPYAVLVMVVSTVFGYFPATFFARPDRPWLPYACLGVSALVLTAFVLARGKRPVARAAP